MLPKLIEIEGINGCGKSTLLTNVKNQHCGYKLATVETPSFDKELKAKYKQQLIDYLTGFIDVTQKKADVSEDSIELTIEALEINVGVNGEEPKAKTTESVREQIRIDFEEIIADRFLNLERAIDENPGIDYIITSRSLLSSLVYSAIQFLNPTIGFNRQAVTHYLVNETYPIIQEKLKKYKNHPLYTYLLEGGNIHYINVNLNLEDGFIYYRLLINILNNNGLNIPKTNVTLKAFAVLNYTMHMAFKLAREGAFCWNESKRFTSTPLHVRINQMSDLIEAISSDLPIQDEV